MEFVYMRSVESLLAEAVEKCHGQAELARQLGIHRQEVNAMIKGERPVSPETVALLCDVLELPAEEVQRLVAETIIGAAKNASKRERLKRAFFGCWVVGVVATTLTSIPTPSNAGSSQTVGLASNYPIYIVAHLARLAGRRIRARAFAFAQALRGPSSCAAWCAQGAL
jgi:plasmid maintenance system antidote protein VapI